MSLVQRLIYELGPWSWWILGLVLLGLEILAPGTFFLWFGIAAVLVGTLALLIDVSWQLEVLIFLGLSLASLTAGRMVLRRNAKDEGDPRLNRRGSRYIGRSFVLEEPVSQGSGRLKIGDTVWRISGPDCPAGSKVRVTDLDGSVLLVEPIEST